MMTGGNRLPSTWTEKDEIELKRLWEVEELSAGHISYLTGRTRNAVIGKVHRLGLAERKSTISPAEKRRRFMSAMGGGPTRMPRSDKRIKVVNYNIKQNGHKVAPTLPNRMKAAMVEPLNGTGVPILKSKDHHCKAVVKLTSDDKKELAWYCGNQVVEGESYCAEHYVTYHQPPRLRLR